jgi:3-hydroxyisobutyrate dehydrogenase-like beta-hydroxyacid dehydrogenase
MMSANSSERRQRIAFIGLGRMGFPMAGHLAKADHSVTVFNRTRARADEWAKQYPGLIAGTPAEAAQEADIVCICVSRDQDVREVVYGPSGVLATLRPQSILVDHSTGSVTLAKELSEAAEKQGCFALDAPVAGGEPAAIGGTLAIMIGGDVAALEKCKAALQVYAKSITHMGPNGCGQLMKMVNQVCLSGVAQGLAEGLALASQAGLNESHALQVLSGGAGRSFWMEYRGPSIVARNFSPGFKVDLMRKDLGIALAQAKTLGLKLSTVEVVDGELQKLQGMGRGADDVTAIFDVIL